MWKTKKTGNSILPNSPLGFEGKLESIKSMFKKAHDDASNLIDDITTEVSAKEEEVRAIQANIHLMKETQDKAKEFVSNLEKLI